MARFGRVLTAMVTPFDAQGELNIDAAVALAKWLVEQGNDGLVVCGTTGESPTLSIDEKLALFEAVVNAVNVPVLAGTTGSNTMHDIGLTEQAGHLGVAGILAVCPYYNRPSQAGIEMHFRAIAGSTDLPRAHRRRPPDSARPTTRPADARCWPSRDSRAPAPAWVDPPAHPNDRRRVQRRRI